MNDQFEQALRRALRSHEPTDAGIDELRQFASSLPLSRRRLATSPLVTLGVVAAAVLVGAVLAQTMPLRFGDGTSGAGIFLVDRQDPRFEACGGTLQPTIAAFPLPQARQFHDHFPNAGSTPELDAISEEAFVVVFEGPWKGPYVARPFPVDATPGFAWPTSATRPNHHDICVWLGDATDGSQRIFRNVDTSAMHT